MPTIQLSKGYTAQIDDIDADLLEHSYWASVNGPRHTYAKRYVRGSKPYRAVHLHREIAERAFGPIPPDRRVDHVNGDTLDDRRANLRVVSHQANICNQHSVSPTSQTGIRGVRYRPEKPRSWQAYIREDGRTKAIGSFFTMEEARDARLAAERARALSLAA